MLDEAIAPLAHNPELRQRLLDVRRSYEQLIDEVSADTLARRRLLGATPTDRARATVESFRAVHRGAPRRDHRAPDPLQPPARRSG